MLRKRTKTACGLQDIGVAESGAHTGEVAGEMAQEVGAEWVIVGHSERRSDQQESDELIAAESWRRHALNFDRYCVLAKPKLSAKTAKQWPL